MTHGTTILRGIVGSTAYGLSHPGSDVDRLGLYVAPTRQFHGLHLPTGKAASRVQTSPSDYTEHEAGKYLSLLLSCNPTVTELLWLPDDLYEIKTFDAEQLIAIRLSFLSANGVRNAYLGYAMQQFKKLSDRGDGSFYADTRKRTAKHARHLMRLCYQGFALYCYKDLPIRLASPESYHEFGDAVAAGDIGRARKLLSSYEDAFDRVTSVLPESPDESAAEEWLLKVRDRFYRDDA